MSLVELEARVEWLARLEHPMAHNMSESMIPNALQDCWRCHGCCDEGCHSRTDSLYEKARGGFGALGELCSFRCMIHGCRFIIESVLERTPNIDYWSTVVVVMRMRSLPDIMTIVFDPLLRLLGWLCSFTDVYTWQCHGIKHCWLIVSLVVNSLE